MEDLADLDEMDLESIDWRECPGVEIDPKRQSGAPVFAGTRIPINVVTNNLDLSVNELIEEFSVTREQVNMVVGFIRKHRPLAARRKLGNLSSN